MKTGFDLRQLRYFVAVGETLSFRRASERLFISQPPLSRQVRALEQALGVRLFERSTTMVRLTAAGEQALRQARKLLADVDGFSADMRKLADRARESARIGVSVAVPVSVRARLVAAWKKDLRATRPQVEFGESKALLVKLRRGQLDYALVGALEPAGDLGHEDVHTIPLVAVLPRSHPAARKTKVRLADLADTPFFWIPRTYNPSFYDACAKVFARRGFKPRVVTVQPGELVTLQRIAEGEGCTLMSASQISGAPRGVVSRPLLEGADLGIRLAAVWARGDEDPGREALGMRFAKSARRIL